jgi:predicted extracellular nuclease
MKKFSTLFILLLVISSCSRDLQRKDHDSGIILSNDDKLQVNAEGTVSSSTTIGNLVATAIQETHNLEVVLYPTELLKSGELNILAADVKGPGNINSIVNHFPRDTKDQFLVGTMKGKDIRDLIIDRSLLSNMADFQVAGIRYQIEAKGGIVMSSHIEGDWNLKYEEDRYYRVAISNYMYFSGNTFPSYRFGNGLSFSFKVDGRIISARDSVRRYLETAKAFPDFNRPRAFYKTTSDASVGQKEIYEIQGPTHRSPLWGKKVITKGIVTAKGRRTWYPLGYDFYIQSKSDDNNPTTSNGIHVYLRNNNYPGLNLGDEVLVEGVVYEEMTGTQLTRTSIQEVSRVVPLSRNNPLPAPILLGDNGVKIPDHHVSTYVGDLNFKPALNLADGIDFWESLEGMRVSYENPRIAGFRGGKEDVEIKEENRNQRGYLNLYTIPNGLNTSDERRLSKVKGIIADEVSQDYNPEIIQIVANHLTYSDFATNRLYNVGTYFEGPVTGVMTYDKNLFGDGEFVLVLPEIQETIEGELKGETAGIRSLRNKPQTTLVAEEDKLTVATYNLENLAANQPRRIRMMAESVRFNLQCPDIVNLVEIQDNNGLDFAGGSAADKTIATFLKELDCGAEYGSINIDPVPHTEGGQPGGNIRVVMIYNKDRVGFERRGNAGPRTPARIVNGQLQDNPSRVYPTNDNFLGTRGSLVAEFTFKGEKVIMIGNHFNSKLGDTSHWSAIQPVVYGSEEERGELSRLVNQFVGEIQNHSDAKVIALGDFNSLPDEVPMQILKSANRLHNLMDLMDENDRYTTNHNGNSQALDYIFVGNQLMNMNPETEVPHINSDYMGRLSDHDPVVARFTFK